MKKTIQIVLTLIVALTSLAGQADPRDAGRLALPAVQGARVQPLADVPPICHCDCQNGKFVCNSTECSLHGEACFEDDAQGSFLDRDVMIDRRTQPGVFAPLKPAEFSTKRYVGETEKN